jgi:hypothetical protein
VNQACKRRLARLSTILRETEPLRAPLQRIKQMQAWVLQAEHILDGKWANDAEEITNGEVSRRFDSWLKELETYLQRDGCHPDEQRCLGYFLKVLTALRPWLIHCYDVADLPRTNNEMELLIRAIKTRYRRISGRKNWNGYLLRYGRCVAYYEYWKQQVGGGMLLEAQLRRVTPSHWRHVRQQSRESHRPLLNRIRLRLRPLKYLAELESRWEQIPGM